VTATFGTTPEDSWWKMALKGTPNKDIFIDD
jgi:hypothetical protein